MKKLSVMVIVIAFVVGVATPVGAADNLLKQLVRSCKADIKTYCKDVKRGEGRVIMCLQDHSDQLSTECAAVTKEFKQMEAEMARVKEQCSADFDKYCKDVKPGKGRIFKCIKDNEDNISQACKDALKESDVKEQCNADFDKYCKEIKPGEGRVIKCIKDNEANISQKCKEALKKAES